MALSQKLEMRQSQALVMTPQLMQAIKLLQLSSLDLAAYVETELERNPLLERFRLAEPGEGIAACVLDQIVNGLQSFPVGLLPITIVFPRLVAPQALH